MGFERRLVKEAVLRAAGDAEKGAPVNEQEIFRQALILLSRQG